MAGLAGDDLGHRHAFVLGLVGQHRAAHDVADGVDARHVGLEMIVDHHAAAIGRDAGLLEPEPFRVGPPPDRHQNDVGLDAAPLAARSRLEPHRGAARGLVDGR